MKAILGEKLGMTQVFDEDARAIPVTVIKAGPCFVTQIKRDETDGWEDDATATAGEALPLGHA